MSLGETAHDTVEETADTTVIQTHKGLKKYIQILADGLFKTPLRIAGTAVLILCCIGVTGWNFYRLSLLDAVMVMEIKKIELSDHLRKLEAELAGIDVDALEQALLAQEGKVFQGFPELAAWGQSLSSAALNYGIALRYQIGEARPSTLPNILTVPVTLDFKAAKGSADSLFIETMQVLSIVLNNHWHIDVLAASGKGDGQNLDQITVSTEVWVRDRFGFVDTTQKKEESGGPDIGVDGVE